MANLINRGEETAATCNLLNTAKLIEDNPVLLRLKELEKLEKVTEKIGSLTVFGGLDGVMNQLVSMRPYCKNRAGGSNAPVFFVFDVAWSHHSSFVPLDAGRCRHGDVRCTD